MINYVDGDLIKLAKEAKFDVIVHGCNCLSTMGAGIAPQMAAAFGGELRPIYANGEFHNKTTLAIVRDNLKKSI